MADVALLKCDEYSIDVLKEKFLCGFELIGFDPACFANARVALKPNLLSAVSADSAVITHPIFFQAVAETVMDFGGAPLLVESPAVASLKSAMHESGYDVIIQRLGIPVADTKIARRISFLDGRLLKYFEISAALYDVDMLVNIPKFKTHNLTYITAAVKNLFGCIPGMRKSQMHMRFPDKEMFSEIIVDLYGALVFGFDKPMRMLHVLDAVVSMEGDGPGSSGSPRKTGAVIIGEDAIAVDYVATLFAGLDMKKALTVLYGFMRGFGVSSPDEIRLKGEKMQDMRICGFQTPKTTGMTAFLQVPLLGRIAKDLFVEKPVPRENACTLCYECMHICPADAIDTAVSGRMTPRFDYHRCIRCFCCMEICPEAAISLKEGVMQWLLREK